MASKRVATQAGAVNPQLGRALAVLGFVALVAGGIWLGRTASTPSQPERPPAVEPGAAAVTPSERRAEAPATETPQPDLAPRSVDEAGTRTGTVSHHPDREVATATRRAEQAQLRAAKDAATQAATARPKVEAARRRASEEAVRQAAIAKQKVEAARRSAAQEAVRQAAVAAAKLEPARRPADREAAWQADIARRSAERLAREDTTTAAPASADDAGYTPSPSTAAPSLSVLGLWCEPCTDSGAAWVFVERVRAVLSDTGGVRLQRAPWDESPAVDRIDFTRLFEGSTAANAWPDLDAFAALARVTGADAVLVGVMIRAGAPPGAVRVFLVDAATATLFSAQAGFEESEQAVRNVLQQWSR